MTFALHHVGFLVKDVPMSAQDWVSRLGYVVVSEIIEDTVQTAFVQFLRQPGATSFIELVAPNGPNSKVSRALKKGGGLHHLCYEVEDIEKACEHLRDQTMLVLSQPVPAAAFQGRRIAWLMDVRGCLIELVERGSGTSLSAFLGDGE